MNARQQVEQMCVCLCRQEALYGEWAKAHGMSYNTVMTLYALAQARGCTQKQIAEEWLIPKQTVNTIVKELERQGFRVQLRVLLPGGLRVPISRTHRSTAREQFFSRLQI